MLPLAVLRRYINKIHRMDEPVRCSRRCGHISFTNGENLYVWGGHCVNGPSNKQPSPDEVWVFHSIFEAWSVKKCSGDIPKGTSGACCGIVFPYLYVLCGHCQDVGHSNRVRRLNLTNFVWEAVNVNEPLISPRDKAVSWVYKDKLYCFGGYGPDPEFSGLFQRGQGDFVYGEGYGIVIGWNNQLLTYDPSENTWSIVSYQNPRTVPLPRAAHAAVLMGEKVYMFGGRHRQYRMNDMHCLDMDTLTWAPVQVTGPVPQGRSWHSLSRLDDNRLFLFGGFSQYEEVFDDVWLFTLSEQRWTKIIRENGLCRGWHTAVVTNSQEVLVFGGFTENILAEGFSEQDVTDTIVRFRFRPLSLKQRSLEKVHSLLPPKVWDQLPKPLQEWLHTKRDLQAKYWSLNSFNRTKLGRGLLNGFQERAGGPVRPNDNEIFA